MRVLCLWFPRMGALLAGRQHPGLAGRPLVLVGGGPLPLVTGCSTEATARGVACGMPATEARGLAPHALFLPDNAGACLDELGRVGRIIRLRASERVELGGRDHLFIDLSGDPDREAVVARRLRDLAAAWSGLEVRAGVASDRRTAFEAAHAARRFPLICAPDEESNAGATLRVLRDEELRAARTFEPGAPGADIRAALVRMLQRLQAIISARCESYREATVTLGREDDALPVVLRPPRPLHDAAAVVDLLRRRVEPSAFDSVTRLEVTLGRLGPDVRVQPARSAAVRAPRPAHAALALPRAG